MQTNFQRLILLSYKAKQAKTPTLGSMIQGYWLAAVTLIVGALLAGGALFALHLYTLAYLVAGGVLGWLVHTVWMFQKVIEGWPTIVQVLDWNKVDQLLDHLSLRSTKSIGCAVRCRG
jgi:uncharacterized membrane protein